MLCCIKYDVSFPCSVMPLINLTGSTAINITEVAAYLEVLEASLGNGKLFLAYVKLLLSWPINSL